MFDTLSLDAKLIKAVTALGWQTPTAIQTLTIPKILTGADFTIAAETGAGKTAAYLLPALHKVLLKGAAKVDPQALILAPTRELAQQIRSDCDKLSQFCGLKSVVIRGGQEFNYQAALLRRSPDIVIATPGRLREHLDKGTLSLAQVETLVLDECDRMLDMGFRDEVLAIASGCPARRQTLLLSATLKHRGINKILEGLGVTAEALSLRPVLVQQQITQQIIFSDNRSHKLKLIIHLLQQENFAKAIVFTNTRQRADEINEQLGALPLRTAALHGEVAQDRRQQIINDFRHDRVSVLIATDLAARGLDIAQVDLIINADMAQSGDEHVHRVGRSGRAGRTGLAISLIEAHDYNRMSSIERYLRLVFERREIGSLKSAYKGPARLKNNGKAVSAKRKKTIAASKKTTKKKHRHNKDVGKRRLPSRVMASADQDGFAPLKRQPTAAKPEA